MRGVLSITMAVLLALLPLSVLADSDENDWPNTNARHTLMWRTYNGVSATHFDGTFCLPRPGATSNNPLTCTNITTNVDSAYFTTRNYFVGTCWAYIYSINGTWNDGTDSAVFDLRFQNQSTSTDSSVTLTVTADVTWTSKAFNIMDPFADTAPTADLISLRPSINSLTDANASVTDMDILFLCDVSEIE